MDTQSPKTPQPQTLVASENKVLRRSARLAQKTPKPYQSTDEMTTSTPFNTNTSKIPKLLFPVTTSPTTLIGTSPVFQESEETDLVEAEKKHSYSEEVKNGQETIEIASVQDIETGMSEKAEALVIQENENKATEILDRKLENVAECQNDAATTEIGTEVTEDLVSVAGIRENFNASGVMKISFADPQTLKPAEIASVEDSSIPGQIEKDDKKDIVTTTSVETEILATHVPTPSSSVVIKKESITDITSQRQELEENPVIENGLPGLVIYNDSQDETALELMDYSMLFAYVLFYLLTNRY